jgi:hypothetical protein
MYLCVCDTLQQGKEIDRSKGNANGMNTQLPQGCYGAADNRSASIDPIDVEEEDTITRDQEDEEQSKDSNRYIRKVQQLELFICEPMQHS